MLVDHAEVVGGTVRDTLAVRTVLTAVVSGDSEVGIIIGTIVSSTWSRTPVSGDGSSSAPAAPRSAPWAYLGTLAAGSLSAPQARSCLGTSGGEPRSTITMRKHMSPRMCAYTTRKAHVTQNAGADRAVKVLHGEI